MNIKYCTITGVDFFSDISKINELSQSYDFVEWGILLHHHANRARYPLPEQIQKILRVMRYDDIKVSIHLCGAYTHEEFLSSLTTAFGHYVLGNARKFPEVGYLKEHSHKINRIQINNSFDRSPDGFRRMQEIIDNFNIPIITQYNDSNVNFTKYMENVPNHHVLYDSSRGTGIPTERYDPPQDFNRMWGYAGGISDMNISLVLYKLNATLRGLHKDDLIWIDMESGVRTNNRLDMTKVENVLKDVDNR